MRDAALLICADGPPKVVVARSWNLRAIARQLHCSAPMARIIQIGYSTEEEKSLVMAINPELHEPVNERACALAGEQALPIAGDTLLIAMRENGRSTTLTELDLAAIAVRLVVDEAIFGLALPEGDLHG